MLNTELQMPPQSHVENDPGNNLTLTQFFTKLLIKVWPFSKYYFMDVSKLLIKVPQVDLEKLPPHLLGDIAPKKTLLADDICDDDEETDIYSLEHEENIEEFKRKGTWLFCISLMISRNIFRSHQEIHPAE